MHARVSSFQSPPEQLSDDAVETVRTKLLPRVREMDGYRGAIFLMDRDTGKSMTVTLWDSEEAMRASEEKANQVRGDAAQTTSGDIGSVERFEAPVAELP